MLRREAICALLGAASQLRGNGRGKLDAFFDSARGAALMIDVPTGRLLAVHDAPAAGAELVPPGSTVKPFVLLALMRSGKLTANESLPCPGALSIAGRSFACSHPPVAEPMRIPTALAYSCNCFVAHFAERFAPGELAGHLERAGLASRTGLFEPDEVVGRIRPAAGRDANRLEALGEEGVLVTAAGLGMAYRKIALAAGRPEMQLILEGLEGAVEFGTAQLAGVRALAVAGKTGSTREAKGARFAWFAGFAPSREPRVVVTVVVQGRSGGADAAPVAGRIFEAFAAGKL